MAKEETVDNEKDLNKVLSEFYNKLESEQVDLEPEFQKVVDDNFWDLLIKEDHIPTFHQYEIKRLGSRPRGLFKRFGDK